MKKANYIILDCETGGFDNKKNPITQIALLEIDNNLKEINRFETYIKPYNDLEITSSALAVTGLKMTDINNGVDFKEAVKLITLFFKENMPSKHPMNRPVIIGHNLDFDIGFIEELFRLAKKDFSDIRNRNPIDTQTLMKMLMPNITSLALGKCCEEMGISLPDAHKAMNDVVATTDLFRAIVNRMKNSTSKGVKQTEQIKSRQTFQF